MQPLSENNTILRKKRVVQFGVYHDRWIKALIFLYTVRVLIYLQIPSAR